VKRDEYSIEQEKKIMDNNDNETLHSAGQQLFLEVEELQRNYEYAFDEAMVKQDNRFKRALIPPIKALIKSVNAYITWSIKHPRASYTILGAVVLWWILVGFIALITIAMTPLGLGLILIGLFFVVAYCIGKMINPNG